MPRSNTADSYGSVTRTFHWLTAFLVISMIPLGIVAHDLAQQIEAGTSNDLDRARFLFSLHKTIGVFIFFAALARILWALINPKPKPLHPERRAETFLASLVHWLLYASLVLVPLTGWVHHAATSGFAPIWWPFGDDLPFVPDSPRLAETFASLHIIFERVLALSILLHVAGALKHHIIDKDATLKRMWNGTHATGAPASGNRMLAPAAATGVYAAALAIGAGLGLFSHANAQGAALEAVASDWAVTDGTLGITVVQFGSPVTGAFADWTSAISFDPDATDAEAGRVSTTIAIGSLSLGSVTSQAMGAAYFNEPDFPTASYDGTLLHDATGYRSEGTLTIKGVALPVNFPFELVLNEDTATVTATAQVSRTDYNIGGADVTEQNLQSLVVITIELTATRTP